MNEVFNTPFEAELRILLVLDAIIPQSATIDRVAIYDFMAIFGRDFAVAKNNLHGNSNYSFSEYPSKRNLIDKGLKVAVRDGFINIETASKGFLYSLSGTGKKLVDSLQSNYKDQYCEVVKSVHSKYQSISDTELVKSFNDRITNEGVYKGLIEGCHLHKRIVNNRSGTILKSFEPLFFFLRLSM